MTSISPVQCYACARLHRSQAVSTMPGESRTIVSTCDAFPNGIPMGIALGGADHREAFAGDNGIRFRLAPGPDAAEALKNWRETFGGEDR